MTRRCTIASLAGLAVSFASLSPAAAQDALGDGTALDANQQVGAGRINRPGPSIQDELRFRNAIVTGNAPGGLSFRGDVGYTAPFEFRGSLGSDDLFQYRRDSFYSGLAGMGIRGTEGLQYQFALTTGNTPPSNLRGSLIASRSGMEPGGFDVSAPGFQGGGQDFRPGPGRIDGAVDFGTIDETSPLADPRGQALWTLRSAAAYDAERRFDPSMLTVLTGDDGQRYGLTASPLRSVTIEAMQRPQDRDQQRQRPPPGADDRAEGPEGRIDGFLPASRYETYVTTRQQLEAPDGLAREGDETGAPGLGEDHVTSWRRTLDAITQQLEAAEQADPAAGARDPRDPSDPGAALPGDDARKAQRELLERLLDDETIRALQEAPGEYETLWRPSARDFDAYTVHMSAGERLLGEGRYFEAEERFMRALANKPGDPLAAAGRVHSELGAGLFVSASLNLRELFVRHPEIIGARYQGRLLPDAERRGLLSLRLRANIDRSPESALARQSALLLAYLGFQSDDPRMVDEGLARLEVAGDNAMATVLRRVWRPQIDAGDDQP